MKTSGIFVLSIQTNKKLANKMSEFTQFLKKHNDVDSNVGKDGNIIIEAYSEDGEIIDTWPNARYEIQEYFETKFGKNYPYSGNELISEEFEGNYHTAFEAIKEDLYL